MSAFTPHDICAWAGRQCVGGAKRKAVLNALALFADRMTWECWPSFALIAQYTEIAERTVSRAVAELERDGFIARDRIRRRDGSLGGWRFRLNPQGVETVIPGRPGAAEGEDEEAEEALAGDGEPQANLAGGDLDAGERLRNDPQDLEGDHPPTRPGGETTTVVKLASPPATGGGSKELPLGTTTSPLPPSLPGAGAACLPDGQAAPPAIDDPASAPASPIDRFRGSLREAVGDAVWRAWFEDLHYRTEAPPDAFGAGSVVTFDTASALRRDRLDQQYRQVIADHWRAAKGLPPDWHLRIAIIVDPARAEEARRAREAARAAARESDGDRAPRRAREGRR